LERASFLTSCGLSTCTISWKSQRSAGRNQGDRSTSAPGALRIWRAAQEEEKAAKSNSMFASRDSFSYTEEEIADYEREEGEALKKRPRGRIIWATRTAAVKFPENLSLAGNGRKTFTPRSSFPGPVLLLLQENPATPF